LREKQQTMTIILSQNARNWSELDDRWFWKNWKSSSGFPPLPWAI